VALSKSCETCISLAWHGKGLKALAVDFRRRAQIRYDSPNRFEILWRPPCNGFAFGIASLIFLLVSTCISQNGCSYDRNRDPVNKILSERALTLFRKCENLWNDTVKRGHETLSGKKRMHILMIYDRTTSDGLTVV
jgi:hypothetical protein